MGFFLDAAGGRVGRDGDGIDGGGCCLGCTPGAHAAYNIR